MEIFALYDRGQQSRLRWDVVPRAGDGMAKMRDRRRRSGMASSDLWYVVVMVGLQSRIISGIFTRVGRSRARMDEAWVKLESSVSNSSQLQPAPLSSLSLL
jgi:hypothetical protein